MLNWARTGYSPGPAVAGILTMTLVSTYSPAPKSNGNRRGETDQPSGNRTSIRPRSEESVQSLAVVKRNVTWLPGSAVTCSGCR